MVRGARHVSPGAADAAWRYRDRIASHVARVRTVLPDKNEVALTFDDGPDSIFTAQLLDVLTELDVLATFFLVGGKALAEPELVQRMIEDGHAVGSHSMSHPDAWTLNRSELRNDYKQGRLAVESIAKRNIRLFRPPKGYLSVSSALSMRALDLDVWKWSLETFDWQPGANATNIAGACRQLGNGPVVLLHDSIEKPEQDAVADRSATIAALPDIVQLGRAQGKRFVTLPS